MAIADAPDPDRVPIAEVGSLPPPTISSPEPTPRPGFKGAFKLCHLAGTDVFIHWSWFVAAVFLIQDRPVPYSSLAWDVTEYLAVFALVLLHEFGHVLACRRVGGTANRVLLWPLGGLAFVAPPPRPGALFKTIAAGPLVNVALAPILFLLKYTTDPSPPFMHYSDLNRLLFALAWFNVVMLAFNLLPIFPLDGGRMLEALLWRLLGRIRGLAISAGIGMVAGTGLAVLMVREKEWWLVAMSGFLVLGAFGGLTQGRLLSRLRQAERHTDRTCPNCDAAPPVGAFWRCSRCLAWFDMLAEPENCPKGGYHTSAVSCIECGHGFLPDEWVKEY